MLTHNFTRIVRRAGLERVRFHDLRHTFASLALLCGAKPKVISEALGHASVAFTMDTYSHIISGMQEDMMALLDEVLPSGIPSTSNERQNRRQSQEGGVLIEQWKREYNQVRPHSSLSYRPPAPEAIIPVTLT